MRRFRGLLLVVIALIVGAVGTSYYRQKAEQGRNVPVPPAALRAGIEAASSDWVYRKDNGNCPQWELRAGEMESAGEPASKVLLKRVQMKLFRRCGAQYDFVRSEAAEFDKANGRMFSEGAVEITLAVKNTLAGTVAAAFEEAPEQPGRLLTIRSSGLAVEAESGKARTDQPASFQFDLGEGSSTGASYDPGTRELALHSNVKLLWRGRNPEAKPMNLEAGRLLYNEAESKVFLTEGARLKRDNLTLDADSGVVTLENGAIRLVEAAVARGEDQYPNRHLTFSAATLHMILSEKSEVEKISGSGNARLEALSDSARTQVDTERIDLDFDIVDKASLLKSALASGKTVVQSRPAARGGKPAAPVRVLRAESVLTKMRAGGEEIEAMETHTPGTLDLIPSAPGQPYRNLKAQRMWITYGAKNQLESFRAQDVTTETRKPARDPKKEPPPAFTWSSALLATFQAATGDMERMEQWTNFRYREGTREAIADHATLDAATNLITLQRSPAQAARVWDPTGSVVADRIVMHQQTGDFTAEGGVSSSRLPDKKATTTNAMVSADEPMQATANRMTSAEDNQRITYEGNAVLWQSANRLQADRVIIRRKEQALRAEGRVVSQFLDKKANARSGRPTNTVVRAAALDYDDKEKLAHYTGGVRLLREGMDVKSDELRAWLNSDKDKTDSTLNRAFADGQVEIFHSEAGRTRRGTSGHAEYYVGDERVVLNGGIAEMVDSRQGLTRGRQLTYQAGNDTLQVEGAIAQPVVSRIRRN